MKVEFCFPVYATFEVEQDLLEAVATKHGLDLSDPDEKMEALQRSVVKDKAPWVGYPDHSGENPVICFDLEVKPSLELPVQFGFDADGNCKLTIIE